MLVTTCKFKQKAQIILLNADGITHNILAPILLNPKHFLHRFFLLALCFKAIMQSFHFKMNKR